MSSLVKLQGHGDWHNYDEAENVHFPFSFSPVQVQGFSEYQAVYSHFKILKVVMTIIRPQRASDIGTLARLESYAVIPSRTFAASQAPFNSVTNTPLGQTKWFKERLVSETKQAFRVGFYPYTMVGTFGPSSVGNAGVYQRVWEGRRWMPFSWAWQDPEHPDQQKGTSFWGPFITFRGAADQREWTSVNVDYTIYVKFKGQK